MAPMRSGLVGRASLAAAGVALSLSALGSSGSWTTRVASAGPSSLESISCPTSKTCFAAGSGSSYAATVFRTTDGGMRWQRAATPSGVGIIGIVDCPSVVECVAVAGNGVADTFLVSTDAGAHWTTASTLDTTLVSDLSCVSIDDCYAILEEGTVVHSVDGATTWSQLTSPIWSEITNLTCTRQGSCFVVGYSQVQRLEFGRISQSSNAVHAVGPIRAPASYFPSSFSCPVPSTCMVGSNFTSDLLVTTTGGRTWITRVVPMGFELAAADVSCPTTTNCVVPIAAKSPSTAVEAATTRDLGRTWSRSPITNDPNRWLIDVVCPTASACYADGPGIGDSSVRVFKGGRSGWKLLSLPSGPPALTLAACSPSGACIAAGSGDLLNSNDAGVHWRSVRWSLPKTLVPTALVCVAPTRCLLGGKLLLEQQTIAQAVVYESSDLGLSWTLVLKPSGSAAISAIVCLSESCQAFATVGQQLPPSRSTVFISTDGGHRWARLGRTLPDVVSVSCPNPGWCLVGGSNGQLFQLNNSGPDWNSIGIAPPPGPPPSALVSLACASEQMCLALGIELPIPASGLAPSGVFRTDDGGRSWKSLSSPGDDGTGLACVRSICWELAQTPGPASTAVESTDGGATWGPIAVSEPVLSQIVATGSGWLVVGGDARNGAFVATTP
jgi:photosystem II stability/assembly factor-like uncharacterized protein